MARRTLGVLVLALVLLGSGHVASAAPGNESAARGVRHPVPWHVVRMGDKLKVDNWLTAVSEDLKARGVNVPAECDEKFGRTYYEKWKSAKYDICEAGGQSTFTCFEHPMNDRGGNVGTLFCSVTNLVLDSADFLGDVLTRPQATTVGGARFPTPKKGSARVACAVKQPLPWTRDKIADNQADKWLYDALAPAPAAEVTHACSDPSRTVNSPVYFVTRMDPTNAFHHYEEVNQFFAAMWLYPNKELLQQGITVVALDGAVPGYYLELWRRIAFPYKVRFLRKRPYPPGTCFKNALLAAMPHRSLYTYFWPGRPTTCRSLVFSAIMKWAQDLMFDARPESYIWPDGQHRQNEATVVGRVLWVSRRHFEAANSATLNGWQRQRMIDNEDKIVPALSAAVTEWNAKSCLRSPGDASCRKTPVYFEFQTMELGDHRWYPEQLSALSRTNVLVAVHGAGVFNEVWLRPATGSVIEVLHNSGGNFHYGNIANMLGLPYYDMGSAADPGGLAGKLTLVMEETATRMAAEHARKAAAEKAAAAGAA